jgi:uncharacterized protein YndB with AHSA1/START domain
MTQSNLTNTRSVIIERDLPYPPQKIWRALTEGPLISQWLLDNDLQPTVGHAFTFRSTPMPGWNGIIESQVLLVEPHTRLSYTWNSMGLESTVVWTISPTATGTHLRMEHSGFRPDQDFAYKGATYGWQNFLGRLEPVVASLQ